MLTALRFLYFLSLIFWIGSIFFFSLIAGPSIFKVLPREAAGNVVTDIFPKYYLIAYACGGVAIITSALSWVLGSPQSGVWHLVRIVTLAVMLGLAAYGGTVIRPQALEVRAEMRGLAEGSPEYQEASKRFGRVHAQSMILNSAVFLLGIAIVLITAYNYKE